MEPGVFLAVLGAAAIHAAWNALIKSGRDRWQGMLLLTATQGAMAAALAAVLPFPDWAAWPWLLASGFFHTFYKLFLISAYQHGDLSRVYPIARGAAPVMVLCIGLVLGSDVIAWGEATGILLVSAGILAMAQGAVAGGEGRALVPFALGSAACTAGYSLADGLGARVSGQASAYVAWLFVLDVLFFSACTLLAGRAAAFRASPADWRRGLAAGALSLASYGIVVWAMTRAPIALVAALRETSVLFAMLIGVFWMGERAGRAKLAAGLAILAGIVLMRL
jgi:drug/metabolite transporter (DMT)-like permease